MEETSTVAVESGYHEIAATENLTLDSEPIAVQPNQVYEAKAWVVGFEGSPGCALVALVFLDESGKEVGRESALIDDFSGRAKQYVIRAQAPTRAKWAVAGYRVNEELPGEFGASSAKIWLEATERIGLSPVNSSGEKSAEPATLLVPSLHPGDLTPDDGTTLTQSGIYYDVPPDKSVALNSEPYEVVPGRTYEFKAWVLGREGSPQSAFLGLMFMDEDDNEVKRRMCWIDDFTGKPKQYTIRAKAPVVAKKAVLACRIHSELAKEGRSAATKVWLRPLSEVRFYVADGSHAPDSPLPYTPIYEKLPIGDNEIRELILKGAASLGSYAQNYTPYHLSRFIELLKFIPFGQDKKRLLELGAFFPFTCVLRNYAGYQEVVTSDLIPWARTNGSDSESFTTTLAMDGESSEEFHSQVFNVETDPFPYVDASFDTVLASEIIEHLALDPMSMLSEVNRILSMGGILIISTPNVTSLKSVAAILEGDNPVGLHTYSKNRSLYARHNHEYTPGELSTLVRKAGFEIVNLHTMDVWSSYAHLQAYATLLGSPDSAPADRGECIFLAARKVSAQILERYPEELYKD